MGWHLRRNNQTGGLVLVSCFFCNTYRQIRHEAAAEILKSPARTNRLRPMSNVLCSVFYRASGPKDNPVFSFLSKEFPSTSVPSRRPPAQEGNDGKSETLSNSRSHALRGNVSRAALRPCRTRRRAARRAFPRRERVKELVFERLLKSSMLGRFR